MPKTATPTEAAPPPAPALSTWRALGPIDHDGARYEAGDSLELTSEQAQALLAVGAVELHPGVPVPTVV
jgi:hypothetical protein